MLVLFVSPGILFDSAFSLWVSLNDNDITHLAQTEASGVELLLNHFIYWTFTC